jgi:TRAP-type mannitol/chloroaromatic compound transport system substrate-binding protein
MKFYEAAKYYYTGGMHEPGGPIAFGFNASFWGSLSNWEKSVITAASMEENAAQFEECMANNGKYLKKLVDEHGVQIKSFNDDVWDSFGTASAEVFEEVRDHSPLAKKIDDAFQKNLREIGGSMANLEGIFLNQRNRILGIV